MAMAAPLHTVLPRARERATGVVFVVLLHLVLAAALLWGVAGPARSVSTPRPISVSLIAERSPDSAARPLRPRSEPSPSLRAQTIPVPASLPLNIAADGPAPVEHAASRAMSAPVTSLAIAPPRFDAAYLDNPAPPYPPLARRMKEQGVVMLHVFVAADGNPSKVEIRNSSGSTRLDQSALETVRHWRFLPARQGERAVAAWVLVPVSFTLSA